MTPNFDHCNLQWVDRRKERMKKGGRGWWEWRRGESDEEGRKRGRGREEWGGEASGWMDGPMDRWMNRGKGVKK